MPRVHVPEARSGNGIHSKSDSAARWLHRRCSVAVSAMQSDVSALELASRIHSAVRSHAGNKSRLQQALFGAVKGCSGGSSRQLDLELVFEVAERAEELMEGVPFAANELDFDDLNLDGSALSAVNDDANDEQPSAGDPAAVDETTEAAQESHHEEASAAAVPPTTIKPRSRHKKRNKESSTRQLHTDDTARQSIQTPDSQSASSSSHFIGDIQVPASMTTKSSMTSSPNNHLIPEKGIFTLPNLFHGRASHPPNGTTAKKSAAKYRFKTAVAAAKTKAEDFALQDTNNLDMTDDVQYSFFEPSKELECVQHSPERRVTRIMQQDDVDDAQFQCGNMDDLSVGRSPARLAVRDKSPVKQQPTVEQSLASQSPVKNSPSNQSLKKSSTPSSSLRKSPKQSPRRSTRSPVKVKQLAVPTKQSVEDNVCEGEINNESDAAASPSRSTRSTNKSVMFHPEVTQSAHEKESSAQNNTESSVVPNLSAVLKPKSIRSSPRKNRGKSNHTDEERQSDSSHAIHRPRRRSRSGPVRIMFTGFSPNQMHKEMIQSLGAELVESVEDAATATHIIVSDGKSKLRRTPKLMICFSKVSKILNVEWLEQSSRQQQLLDTDDFLHIHDVEAEKRYDFSMKETIQNGFRVRRERGGVLGGWWIYICRGVAGNQAPSAKELQLIIEAAGGTLLASLNSEIFDPAKTIILTSDPSTQSQLNEDGVEELMSQGAMVFTTSWLFHTIITQKLTGVDNTNEGGRRHPTSPKFKSPESTAKSPKVSSLVRCNSHESLMSTLTATPIKPAEREKRNFSKADDASVSSRGSRVSNLEYANNVASPKKQKKADGRQAADADGSKKACVNFMSRDEFMSDFSPSTEPFTKDEATIETHTLWLNYFKEFGAGSTPTRTGKGVRCRRGRARQLSPLVTCTSNGEVGMPSASSFKSQNKSNSKPVTLSNITKRLPEHHEHISWEAYVLFTLAIRAADLDRSKSSLSVKIPPATSYFPAPLSIGRAKNKLTLSVGVTAADVKESSSDQKIFGTLQDLFDLHKKYQFGPIPESVLARLTILAIEAVSTMHSCGVVHNDISLDSFLIVRSESNDEAHEDEWSLQLVGFGYKSLVLDFHKQGGDDVYEGDHLEHDYNCLGNSLHMLITGGMSVAIAEVCGQLEFASKSFLKGNLFLRGALSWCALLDALLGCGEEFDSAPIHLEHPLDIFKSDTSDGYPKCRTKQISWACRMFHEISTTNMSLSTFLEGLCRYNPRFILSNMSSTTFSYSASDTRQSFIRSQPTPTQTPSKSNLVRNGNRGQQNCLSEREATLAHREAAFHAELSEIHRTLLENKALHESNIQAEKRIQQKESDVLRREQGIADELRHIQKMKEDLLLRERRLELRIQEAEQNNSPSKQEAFLEEQFQSSPCHSTKARSSVCSGDGSYSASSGKKRKRRKDRAEQTQLPEQPIASFTPHNNEAAPPPRLSEHLCSLQNLGSPLVKSETQGKRSKKRPAEVSSSKQKRPLKKVFIDMNIDD